jgi:multidrug resistance efflux pump
VVIDRAYRYRGQRQWQGHSGRAQQTIAAVEVASVRALLVREGQHVQAGQVLIELDATSSDSERDKAADMLAQARLQVARAAAMMDAVQQLRAPQLETVAEVTPTQWDSVQRQLQGSTRTFALVWPGWTMRSSATMPHCAWPRSAPATTGT